MMASAMLRLFQKVSNISFGRQLKRAEQAADEYKVNITFVGPETEAQVDKQVEMLRSTLDKTRCDWFRGIRL